MFAFLCCFHLVYKLELKRSYWQEKNPLRLHSTHCCATLKIEPSPCCSVVSRWRGEFTPAQRCNHQRWVAGRRYARPVLRGFMWFRILLSVQWSETASRWCQYAKTKSRLVGLALICHSSDTLVTSRLALFPFFLQAGVKQAEEGAAEAGEEKAARRTTSAEVSPEPRKSGPEPAWCCDFSTSTQHSQYIDWNEAKILFSPLNSLLADALPQNLLHLVQSNSVAADKSSLWENCHLESGIQCDGAWSV